MSLLLAVISLFSCFAYAPSQVEVLASSCYLYQNASFESQKVLDGENELILQHGDILTIIQDDEKFYLVETENKIQGYVYKFYVSSVDNYYIYPTFNATVRNENAIVYDLEKSPTQIKAKVGQEVYLFEGYSSSNKFTAVQIVLEDGSLYNGFMLTTDIVPKGISSTLIIGISIIAAVATIVLSLVFIKKKKKTSGSKN